MKFIRKFKGGRCTAILTVIDGKPSVHWEGLPTRSIFPEYGTWMTESLQIVADASGKKILYLCPGVVPEVMVFSPKSQMS